MNNICNPTLVPLSYDKNPIGLGGGPLSLTSFIFLEGVPLGRKTLPALEYSSLMSHMNRVGVTNVNNELRHLRETVASAFSSISVLNASFRVDPPLKSTAFDNSSLCVDLDSVRRSYDLLESMDNDQIMSVLGRSTLMLSEHLKECPWDDTENLSVFLIVLENPLLLKPKSYYIAIKRILSGILALPKSCRLILFSWLKSYPSEYFSRIVSVIHGYLMFGFTNSAMNIDPAPAVLVLDSLYTCNLESGVIPLSSFYLKNLHTYVNLHEEWNKFILMGKNSKVFNYFSYPFIIDCEVKNIVLRVNFLQRQIQQSNIFRLKYLSPDNPSVDRAPRGLSIYVKTSANSSSAECYFEVKVYRSTLLHDLFQQLDNSIADDINVLRLPLRAAFIDEDAVDQGGVKKELITLAIRGLIQEIGLLRPCGNNNSKLWFSGKSRTGERFSPDKSDDYMAPNKIQRREFSVRRRDNVELCYYLGLLIGLAAYNDVLIDLPLPSAIYKVMAGIPNDIVLEDLFDVDSTLARGLKQLLDYDDTSISDVFDINFTASSNPLIDNLVEANKLPGSSLSEEVPDSKGEMNRIDYVELKPDGSNTTVGRHNRQKFVRLFVQWALYGCAKDLVNSYLAGMKVLFFDPLIDLCTHHEVEVLLSGSKEIGDLSSLRMHTKYTGEYYDEHPIIQWFWVRFKQYYDYLTLSFYDLALRIC